MFLDVTSFFFKAKNVSFSTGLPSRWHDGATERYSMVQSAGGCGAGFLYSIAPKQINGDLGCSSLVGWWGGWWWNPSDFFCLGGQCRVIYKALKWTLGHFFLVNGNLYSMVVVLAILPVILWKQSKANHNNYSKTIYIYIYMIYVLNLKLSISQQILHKNAHRHMQNIFFWHLTRVAF